MPPARTDRCPRGCRRRENPHREADRLGLAFHSSKGKPCSHGVRILNGLAICRASKAATSDARAENGGVGFRPHWPNPTCGYVLRSAREWKRFQSLRRFRTLIGALSVLQQQEGITHSATIEHSIPDNIRQYMSYKVYWCWVRLVCSGAESAKSLWI